VHDQGGRGDLSEAVPDLVLSGGIVAAAALLGITVGKRLGGPGVELGLAFGRDEEVLDRLLPVVVGHVEQLVDRPGTQREARRGGDQDERCDPLGMPERGVLRDGAAEGGAQHMRPLEPQRIQQGDEVIGEVAQRVRNRWVHGDPRIALVIGDRPYPRAEVRAERGELGAVALAAVNEHERHPAAAIDVADFELTRPYGSGRSGGFLLYLMHGHGWPPLSNDT
jgi:hypothetical protein